MTIEDAIQRYRTAEGCGKDGDSCYDITPRLIQGTKLSAPQLELVTALDLAFKGTALESSTILFRGNHKGFLDSVAAGDNGAYPSFVSTSRELGEALQFLNEHGEDAVLLRIVCPEGTPYIDVSPIGVATLESAEILLPRGTKYEVSRWDPYTTLPFEERILLGMNPASAYYTLTINSK